MEQMTRLESGMVVVDGGLGGGLIAAVRNLGVCETHSKGRRREDIAAAMAVRTRFGWEWFSLVLSRSQQFVKSKNRL